MAVNLYSVLGVRPSKDFVHAMYSASSNFRACTLRLPSVVFISSLSSLKVRDWLAARALTIPSRSAVISGHRVGIHSAGIGPRTPRSWVLRAGPRPRFQKGVTLATVPLANAAESEVAKTEASA